ncbi:hypothetical protein Tco_0087995 [Tanacetum coccineum]
MPRWENDPEIFDDEADERSSEEYLRDLELEFHERALLENSKPFIKRKNNFSSQKANEDTECYKCGRKVFPPWSKQSPKVLKNYKAEYKRIKAKLALLEAKVSDDEEMTQVKVVIALAGDELSMGKNHAHNGESIDITIKKLNILLYMDEDSDWHTYLKYINLTSYDLLALKHAKLEAVTFQIQNTELTKLNHALQDQLMEERNVNEKWLNSSNKVSQCIRKSFIPASLDYDHEMVPKSKDWVERLNLDNKLPNFNTGRILVPESQAVNECLQLTEAPTDPKSSKELGSEPQTPLTPLKNLQGASPSSEKSKAKPFLPCTLYGFNDHHPDDCRDYLECEICGSYDHFTSSHNRVIQVRGGVLDESSQSTKSFIGVSCTTCGSNVHSTTDHNDFEHFKRSEKIQATEVREPTKKWLHKRN